MTELVKVKGLKGKQNKKKWAKNIDISGLLENKAKMHDEEMREAFQQPLILVDDRDRKLLPLDPDRFKSKGYTLPKQTYNNKIVRKSIFEEHMDDPWNPNHEQVKTKYVPSEIPAIVLPLNGHSYNPHSKDFQEIIERVIDYEGPKVKTFKVKLPKQEKIVQCRARNKNRRAEQLQIRRKREERKFKHELDSIKKLRKLEDEKEKQIIEKIKTKQIKKDKLQNEAMTGRVRYGRKLGKQMYRFKEYIPKAEDLGKKLSKVNSSDELAKERFDSIYRRGLMEPRIIKVHANKTKNIKVKSKFLE